MAAQPVFEFEGDPQVSLLDAVRAEKTARDAAEVRMLKRVIEYCAAHEVSAEQAATIVEGGQDTGLALAGSGAPCVSEFAVTELATALGMTIDAARRYVGAVLEVHHRLPRIWQRVVDLELPWWRAARIAHHTLLLPKTGAIYIDRRLAATAHKVGVVYTEKLCDEALDHYDPTLAEERRHAAAESRHLDVHTSQSGRAGTVEVEGSLETADALDLDTALAQGAVELKANGCEESLDVRRAMAAGLIARHYLGDLLNSHQPAETKTGSVVKVRQVNINVHLHDQDTGRCEETRSPISVAQVRSWCTNPDTQVVIRQIRDLNDHLRVDQWEVPHRLAEQTHERDATCVHPWCTRPARRCDKDHCIPYHQGGQTSSDNIAPLCRRHHRPKTHTPWHYQFLRPGHYLWRSPNGHWYYRDATGTTDLGRLVNR